MFGDDTSSRCHINTRRDSHVSIESKNELKSPDWATA